MNQSVNITFWADKYSSEICLNMFLTAGTDLTEEDGAVCHFTVVVALCC